MTRSMRKMLLAVLGCSLLFLTGTANAALYLDYVGLNRTISGSGSTSWSHDLPGLFSMPPDTVNYASLTILGLGFENNNDAVTLEGTSLGNLGFFGQYFTISTLVTPGTTADGSLVITLNYIEGTHWHGAFLKSSTLYLDWNNNDPNSTPVPEPGTLMLLGSGLVGIATWGRKKFKEQ